MEFRGKDRAQPTVSGSNTTVQSKSLMIKDNQGGNGLFPGPNFGPCYFDERHSLLNVAGNVFLLGLVFVINEILDLMAAQSLDFLLEPCLKADVQTEALAADVAANEAEVEIEGI